MTANLHISSLMNILNSTLVKFVKITFVSHRKVDKRYVEGVLDPPTPAASLLALLRPLFILDKLLVFTSMSLPRVIQSTATELVRVIAGPAF